MVRRGSKRTANNSSGPEPMSGRGAIKFRLALAAFALLILGTTAAAAFLWNDPPFDLVVLGSACAFLAIVALIDIFVVVIRLSTSEQNTLHQKAPRDIGGA